MPEPKDVIIGILGASVALAGLLLVFSGLLFSQAAAFPRDTTDDVIIDGFKRAARMACWPFAVALVIAGACVLWLLCPLQAEYLFSWISFLILLIWTVAYGFWASWRLL